MKSERNTSRLRADRFGRFLIIITVIAAIIVAAIAIIYLAG